MKKINVAELLKDCPQYMDLDCTMYDSVSLLRVNDKEVDFPIIVVRDDGHSIALTKYGQYTKADFAKCVIYPKGKTTWEGFVPPCKFKDGDVCYLKTKNFEYIFIFKVSEDYNYIQKYVNLSGYNLYIDENAVCPTDNVKEIRFATEEEKEKLFLTIKDYGYKWNEKTKTLEKLVELTEDANDKTVMSGIYFDRDNYADEVELHLNNYEIEIRDGKTYAIFKNQENEILKPQFKDGDIVAYGSSDKCTQIFIFKEYIKEDYATCHMMLESDGTIDFSEGDYYITRFATSEEKQKLYQAIKDNGYKWNEEAKTLDKLPRFKAGDRIKKKGLDDIYAIEIKAVGQTIYTIKDGGFHYINSVDKDYELVPNKFDISTLKPFESKVLVRDYDIQIWIPTFWGRYLDDDTNYCNYLTSNGCYKYCIPYEGNEHLLGTKNDCNEYYKTWK